MKPKISPVTLIFWILAVPVALTGFAGLFTRTIGFRMPWIAGSMIRGLEKYTVYGQTLKGRAAIVRGEHWFFLITIGIVLAMAITALMINKWLVK